jgi:protein TonB
MLRHSNSFFISVLVHGVIIGVLFYSYKYVATAFSETEAEKTVCIKLCCVVESEVPKIKEVKQKHLQEKPKPRSEPKQEPKKKVLKEKKKEVIPVKEEPLEIEKEMAVEDVTQEVLEAIPDLEEFTEEEPTQAVESVQTKKQTPQEKYVDDNIQKIIELLQDNLHYPRQARKRGIEGEVLVSFRLSLNAKISLVKVISSESDILSRAAIETIENLSGKFPAPKENLTLTIPITYSLKEAG